MNAIRQVLTITAINLRSIPQRLGTSLVICVGIAGVVGVLTTVLAMATGLKNTLASAAREDRAIVLRSGSLAEALSTVSREELAAIEAAPGIRRTAGGGLSISPEVLISVNLPRKGGGALSALPVRGLTPAASEVRPEVELVRGRMFTDGVLEIVVGESAQKQFANLDIDDMATFHGGDWRVVGVFSSGGDVHESEAMTDATTLMSAAHRTVFSAVTVTLDSPRAFDAFREALKNDPKLNVDPQRETEYYAGQSEQIAALLDIVATAVAGIMAIGAMFGALNTMYSAVGTRTVEIATLRAIGFSAVPVVVSVLAEAQLLALVGAIAGGGIAWLLFNGSAFSTGGIMGQVALELHVGIPLIATGVAWAATIGLLGGLFPAIRAARIPVAHALRAV